MAKATKDITTPNQLPSKELHSKTRRGIRAAAGSARRPRPSPGTPIPTKNVQSSTYVYEIRVDGVVRYIGKGRNGRIYSHMIEAQRTASKPGVKIANLSPHFRKRLVSAIRRGARIKEKIITADLTDDAAYALERHMIGSFHKNHPGQLWNTIDERFMSAEYLPDDWSNPVHPLYKVHRPLTPVDSLNGEDSPRFFGQVTRMRPRHAATLEGAPSATGKPKSGHAGLRLERRPKKQSDLEEAAMTEKSTTTRTLAPFRVLA